MRVYRLYLAYGVLVLLLFGFVYYNCNEHAALALKLYRIHFEWEKDIPFVSWMIIPYVSLYLLTPMPVFVLSQKKIHQFGKAICLSIVLAGIVFYFFPAECALARPQKIDRFQMAFKLLHTIDKPHNLFPSLHIVFSTMLVLAFWGKTSSIYFKCLIIAWFLLICASVLFTHQHHLADIASGFILSVFCHWLFSRTG